MPARDCHISDQDAVRSRAHVRVQRSCCSSSSGIHSKLSKLQPESIQILRCHFNGLLLQRQVAENLSLYIFDIPPYTVLGLHRSDVALPDRVDHSITVILDGHFIVECAVRAMFRREGVQPSCSWTALVMSMFQILTT